MSVFIVFIYTLFRVIKVLFKKKKKKISIIIFCHLKHGLFAILSDTLLLSFWLLSSLTRRFWGNEDVALFEGGTWSSSYSILSRDQPHDLARDSTVCRRVRRYRTNPSLCAFPLRVRACYQLRTQRHLTRTHSIW
jgi:hypothetical protein